MLRLAFLLVALSQATRPAHVTSAPSFADKLDQLYEKLEKFTLPPETEEKESPSDKLYEKLEKLNALTPDRVDLSDEDEEMLTAMQMWGRMGPEQLDGVVKDLQSVKSWKDEDMDYGKSEQIIDGDDSDDWNDVETEVVGDYPQDWYPDEEYSSTARLGVVTPSALNRLGPDYRETIVSAVDPIAATNERPRLMDDSSMTSLDKITLRRAVFANIAAVLKEGKCSVPQPRWLTVRQLAPAANIVYMPPCVQLHRCAPDSGCCYDEAEVCAPIAGKYVAIPFYLQKANGERSMARMKFFNHTQCACVSRETLQTTVRTRVDVDAPPKRETDTSDFKGKQNDWRPSTEEPVLEEEPTAPPQLRRCTCPTVFLARALNSSCTCVCDWSELRRRRDCQSLARGHEHFGMRDRVCLDRGDCLQPTCEYGSYDAGAGRCPLRRVRYRRTRYHHRRLDRTPAPPA